MSLLEIQHLVKHFPLHTGLFNLHTGDVHAVNGVSFSIGPHQKVGLVGESGCGKSTLGKTIARLLTPTSGRILFQNTDISAHSHAQMIPFRKHLQFIFQDPYHSLNPRMTAFQTLREPLRIHRIIFGSQAAFRTKVRELLQIVGLPDDTLDKYPHELSGGQRQRIGIARAIASQPSLLIADEPVSSLDVSVQAQIINLLDELCEQIGLAVLFIAHDLKLVHHFCDRILVMYLGFIVEDAPASFIERDAKHPYTQALLQSVLPNDPFAAHERTLLSGDVPSPIELPQGCPFAARCPSSEARCHHERPILRSLDTVHAVACHLVSTTT